MGTTTAVLLEKIHIQIDPAKGLMLHPPMTVEAAQRRLAKRRPADLVLVVDLTSEERVVIPSGVYVVLEIEEFTDALRDTVATGV